MTTPILVDPSTIVNVQLVYRYIRPVKLRHGISFHCLLVLLSAYLLNRYGKNKYHSINSVVKIGYFNNNKTKYYLNKLIDKGFINSSIDKFNRITYFITQAGVNVVGEIQESYDLTLFRFCSKYNIEL